MFGTQSKHHIFLLIYFVVILRLISKGVFNPSTKKVKTPILYFFNLGWKFEDSDLAHLFEDRTKLKVPSEVKPPLSAIQQKRFFKVLAHFWSDLAKKRINCSLSSYSSYCKKSMNEKTHSSFSIKVITLTELQVWFCTKCICTIFFL